MRFCQWNYQIWNPLWLSPYYQHTQYMIHHPATLFLWVKFGSLILIIVAPLLPGQPVFWHNPASVWLYDSYERGFENDAIFLAWSNKRWYTDNEKEHKVPVDISLIPPKWCMAESTIKLGKVHVDTHQTMKCILVSFISALFVVYWYFVIMDENMFLEFGQFALWLALAGFASWNIS